MTKHKTPESLASDNVLLAANANGCRLYRNNSGVADDDMITAGYAKPNFTNPQ